MANISAKINLRRLQSAQMKLKGKNGNLVECVVIPIDANNLVRGEKGIYLDMIGFEYRERKPDRKDTHMVKQSLAKELLEKMTDDEKNALPILGNMVLWGHQEPEPVNFDMAPPADQPEGTDDDLPF